MIYSGKCHCGKIAFDVEGDLTSVIECNCSICYESGYLESLQEELPSDGHRFGDGLHSRSRSRFRDRVHVRLVPV
jgi:hypothetical protein